ncbi:hypothetical protein BD779DRAFT_723489 [Infundibulicybe gibba]|nr:hypothetical protein BD779DRAFT_723489 [Infundibulicybe gibba]
MAASQAPTVKNIDVEEEFSLPSVRRARRRASSVISVSSGYSKITLDDNKATPTVVVTLRPGKHDAYGSFAPTRSARASLQFIADSHSLRQSLTKKMSFGKRRMRPKALWPVDFEPPGTPDSMLSSSPSSPTIPSIARTASTYYSSSPIHVPHPKTMTQTRDYPAQIDKLDPILASLERKSKLRSGRVHCATCKKPGTDYPRCGKCGEKWCSRECRLVGGKRHVCSISHKDG